ncbi:hypothetical protein BCR32DRAFT_296326 [Anaeromyces robustus]|uniref:LysM domain-containing protein n=1 Tax=Anaeromyces robustus TaxID=1754192 RepID=A0A1Y1WSE6_9FUNG|nr:hypothetical protein BCR32DRAFT_296326 [Anaeromyces robustus]|eukprot:ORX76325.1 hypothetical protein BCR32DRAFT_296326 [Anaeromyces robustus]
MKTYNIIGLLASALTVVSGYDISCTKYYTTSGKEKCLSIINKYEVSLNYFTTLNPDIDCDNIIPDNTRLCIAGNPIISSNGLCGPGYGSCPFGECCSKGKCGNTSDFCGSSCDPNYGICTNLLAGGNVSKSSKLKPTVDFDKTAIEAIATLFSIKPAEAKNFYDFSNKVVDTYDNGFLTAVNSNLSLSGCKMSCDNAHTKFRNMLNSTTVNFSFNRYNKFLNSFGQPSISNTELLELCYNQCYGLKEIRNYVSSKANVKIGKNVKRSPSKNVKRSSRRDTTACYHPSEAKFNVVSNYLNGYNKYTETSDSVITALTFVNGCSIPVIKDLYNENNKGLFVPACNVHDICYGCQGGKASCDSTFLTNMKSICKNQKKNSLVCRATASIFYAAVRVGANKNYNACSNNRTEKECAYCGAPTIQNYLLKTPYYNA